MVKLFGKTFAYACGTRGRDSVLLCSPGNIEKEMKDIKNKPLKNGLFNYLSDRIIQFVLPEYPSILLQEIFRARKFAIGRFISR